MLDIVKQLRSVYFSEMVANLLANKYALRFSRLYSLCVVISVTVLILQRESG